MNSPTFETMRAAMVDSQLRTVGVNVPAVVEALRQVPRERFVPADMARLAYLDEDIALNDGRVLTKPMILGRLLTQALVQPGEHVLLIGAATGYAAAVLATLGAKITAVEENAALAESARGNLAAQGVDGVTVVEGPLTAGAAAGAPYDLLLIDGAVEELPQALLDQVKDGGRIAAPVVNKAGICQLLIGRVAEGQAGYVAFADVAANVLPGFQRVRGFSF